MATEQHVNPIFSTNSDGSLKYTQRIEESAGLSYVEAQLLRGTLSFSSDKLKQLDPSYTGYSHIFVLRLPKFMTQVAAGNVLDGYATNAKTVAENHCKNLKDIIELGSTSYSGTPNLSMQTTEVNTGYSDRTYTVPTSSAYDGKQFTIRCLETRGEPLRRAMEYYINGISDASVKATMLHGATEDGALMHPTLDIYTMSIMVVQTDQTLRNIQDISLWQNVMFSEVDRSNLDWEHGTVDIIQPKDVQFTGVYLPDGHNAEVEAVAHKLLGQRLLLYKRFRDMSVHDMGIDKWSY